MDCSIDCNQDINYYKELRLRVRIEKWLQTFKIEGAEYMSKTK